MKELLKRNPPLPYLFHLVSKLAQMANFLSLNNLCDCHCDFWPCFTALTLQKVKLSDEPVEAKEDYTKFNSKDLKTEKVCVCIPGGNVMGAHQH